MFEFVKSIGGKTKAELLLITSAAITLSILFGTLAVLASIITVTVITLKEKGKENDPNKKLSKNIDDIFTKNGFKIEE